MAGYIKIMRSDVKTGTYGTVGEEFQFSYVTGANAWVRTFDFTGLQNFLIAEVGLTPERTTQVMNQARQEGAATIPGVNLRENEAAALGLAHMPSDQ